MSVKAIYIKLDQKLRFCFMKLWHLVGEDGTTPCKRLSPDTNVPVKILRPVEDYKH